MRLKKLLLLQWRMIKEQWLIWSITLLVIIIYIIVKVLFPSFFGHVGSSIFDGITLSFISAFIFYLFTSFFPESNKRLVVYQNIYITNQLMTSLFNGVIDRFGGPSENGFISPKSFVDKLIVNKDKENDKYTLDPYYMGYLESSINEINALYNRFSAEYISYLSPSQIHHKTLINNAGSILVRTLSPVMTYKHLEGYLFYLMTIFNALADIDQTTKPFYYSNER